MFDVHSDVTMLTAIGNATLSANNTPPAIDLGTFMAAELILAIGIGGITFTGVNRIDFVLTHSDDNVTYTNVTDADMLGVTGITSGIVKSLIAAHAAAATYRYGYVGNKRYLKVLAQFGGTHATGTPIAAIVSARNAAVKPTPNQA